ncbi:MAG: hypothetical protein Unbinned7865contig1001_2 [Prokaryotic dsDNA virus sp.]|nr:MAG: hypothetical protein Unbinned7865contig1001_2 [Prokaryotic dsDNA virus sp.]|tara:strand:- start:20585 stop:20986 length:402 start_codon:yes stop_codon:yes gene_type:complete
MSEAPKVIWAQESASGWDEPVATIYQVDHFPKFHHDDTVTALQAKVARLEAENKRLLDNAKKDAWLWSSYHQWCEDNECAPSSGELLFSHKKYKKRIEELSEAVKRLDDQLSHCLGPNTEAGIFGRKALEETK